MSPAQVRKAAQDSAAVMIAVIIGVTLAVLSTLAAIVFLVWQERDAADILALVNLLISGTAAKAAWDAKALASQVKDQTNGTMTNLIDKATQSK